MSNAIRNFLRLTVSAALIACDGGESVTAPDPSTTAVANITVTLPRGTVRVGESIQAAATLLNSSGVVLSGRTVAWSTSNSSFATVSESGIVKAVAAGQVSINAQADGKTGGAALTITVVPVAGITLSPPTASVTVGQALALAATLSDSAGNGLSGRSISWASSNPARATVSAEGIVTGLAAGTVDITASAEGKAALSRIEVMPIIQTIPVASVTLSIPRTAFRVGESLQAGALALDSSGGVLTGKAITWSSTNPEVASVTTGGLISGVAPGTATVSADVEGKTGAVTVLISLVPVSTVTISPSSESVSAGASILLVAILKDSADRVLSGRAVQWVSNSPAIATVADGVVTGLVVGTATIVATAEGQQGTASVSVNTLTSPVGTVTVSPGNTAMAGVGKKQLTATLRDANGNVLTGRPISWSSSNPDRATVSSTGVVTAAAVDAPVVITATSESRAGTSSIDIITFVRMSSGSGFSCGLTADGTAYCWGQNNQRQLGDGTSTNRLLPTKVATDLKFVLITSGVSRTCGTVASSLAYCWGAGTSTPTPAPGGYTFLTLASAGGTTCGTTGTHELYCWGTIWTVRYEYYFSSLPFAYDYPEQYGTPLKIATGMVAVVGGLDNRFCSVNHEGTAYCGRIGFVSDALSPSRPVSATHRFTTIRMGFGHACGLVASGQAYCWGRNDRGQLGDGTTTARSNPVLVAGGLLFESLAAGGRYVAPTTFEGEVYSGFSCGLTLSAKAYCWGSNDVGQLGLGTTSTGHLTPQAVTGPGLFTGMRAGANHVCGLPLGDGASCWGNNSSGQLGNGATSPSNKPAPLFGP